MPIGSTMAATAAISLDDLPRSLSPVPSNNAPDIPQGSSTGYQVRKLKSRDGYQERTFTTKEDDEQSREEYEYPADKKKCWLVVLGSFMGLVPTWGIANSIGVIQTHILKNELQGTSTTTVSWIFSIFLCISMVSEIFSGTYFDRNGSRGPIFVGSALFCGSLIAVANCRTTYQFILAFGVGVGLGCGILSAPLIGAVPHYFPKNQRATALAVSGNGGCVGGLIIPLMLRTSYKTIGYAWSMRTLAFLSMFCLGIAFFLVKERKLVEKTPMTRLQTVRFYLTSSFDIDAIFHDRKYMFNVIGCVFSESTIVVASGYFSFICVQNGFSQSESFIFVTLMNGLAIPSRWISGIMADRWLGSYNVIIMLLCLTSIVELVIWLPFKGSRPALYTFVIFYGITYGGIMSLIPSCCSEVVKAEKFGSRYATQYFICGVTLLGLMSAGSGIIGSGYDSARDCGFIAYVSFIGLVGAFGYTCTRYLMIGWTLKKV